MNGVKNVTLLDAAEQPAEALQALSSAQSALSMFERLATDPNASVEKIERLMALWERAEARKAEQAFNAAMTAAQAEMRPIAADAYNPQTKSKYASYAALDAVLRPIYTKHGFGLSFNTGTASDLEVCVLCDVTHAGGHSKPYRLDMPADGKGAKGGDVMTLTHATGAALTYGMRYLLKMIFNVAIGEEDKDGNGASRKAESDTAEPKGFDVFLDVLASAAMNGTPALTDVFNKADQKLRAHLTMRHAAKWAAYRTTAGEIDKRPAVKK